METVDNKMRSAVLILILFLLNTQFLFFSLTINKYILFLFKG